MIRSIMKKQNKSKEEIEELQRTQVLNLKDVEETVKYEKSISKKPAMIIAIIGAIFLTLGSTLQIAKTMKKSVEPKAEKREISKEKEIQTVTPVILECQNIQMNNPDGTNITFTIDYTFNNYKLTNFTKKYIKNILARITSFLEEQTGVAPNYVNYMTQTKNPFEIEHIISNHYEWFTDEFSNQGEFDDYRNNIGALLLLHKSINASLSDSEFGDKLEAYCTKGNIYSASLCRSAYNNNPQFLRLIEENDLKFMHYVAFGKLEIMERNTLIIQLI